MGERKGHTCDFERHWGDGVEGVGPRSAARYPAKAVVNIPKYDDGSGNWQWANGYLTINDV